MSNNVNNQYDFFKLVNLDNDGNLGVNVVGGGSGDNYYTTGGTYNSGTEELEFVGNNVLTTFNVDVSGILTNLPYDTSFAISDEVTPIVTGTNVTTIYAPRSFNLTNVKASLTTSGSSISEFDIKVNGVSILSTKITIDSGENTSSTALAPPVIISSSISDDDKITVDILQAGTSSTGGKIYLIGETV
jgi:hypothetical protein